MHTPPPTLSPEALAEAFIDMLADGPPYSIAGRRLPDGVGPVELVGALFTELPDGGAVRFLRAIGPDRFLQTPDQLRQSRARAARHDET